MGGHASDWIVLVDFFFLAFASASASALEISERNRGEVGWLVEKFV